MKFRPTHDRILVKRDDPKAVTEGGLIIPDDAQAKSRHGTIIAVGPGPFMKGSDKRRPIGLEPGQKVCWQGLHGNEIELDGTPHVLLREDEVEGIVE
jgi:chaperonin GroES